MGKNGIPDRWLDYSNHGDVIAGTRIIALKVPLKQALLNKVDVKERFSPEVAAGGIPKLDFIIDLTYTKRYYSPAEFQNRGVGHSKIATEGHVIPNGAVLRRFFDTMDGYLADDSRSGVIGVHCTHGVNRTGYMICRYMISKLGFTPDQAIAAFNKARGHDLERDNYLADLRAANWPELPEVVEEAEPPAEEPDGERRRDRRDHWTPADQRRHRRDDRRRLAGPYGWPPPPRWRGAPPGHRFWRPPPPWAGPDWRFRGPPPPLPPWMRPDGGGGGWRHGPPPPPLPPAADDERQQAMDGSSSQDTDDQSQPESPPPFGDRPAASDLRHLAVEGRDGPVGGVTRLLQPVMERCPVVAGSVTPETEMVIVLSDGDSNSATREHGAMRDNADREVTIEAVERGTLPEEKSGEVKDRSSSVAKSEAVQAKTSPGAKSTAVRDKTSPGAKSTSARDKTSPGEKSTAVQDKSSGAKSTALRNKSSPRENSGPMENRSSRREMSRAVQDRTSPGAKSGEVKDITVSVVTPVSSKGRSAAGVTQRRGSDRTSPAAAQGRTSPGAGPAAVSDKASPAVPPETGAGDRPRRGFRQRAADAGWSWGGRR